MTTPTGQDLHHYVESMVVGNFNEEKLKELFHSDVYRETADRIFEAAVREGNKHIAAESIVWWQEAQASEHQQPFEEDVDLELEPEEEKTDGGGIYLILMVLFLIAYGIKALMG